MQRELTRSTEVRSSYRDCQVLVWRGSGELEADVLVDPPALDARGFQAAALCAGGVFDVDPSVAAQVAHRCAAGAEGAEGVRASLTFEASSPGTG